MFIPKLFIMEVEYSWDMMHLCLFLILKNKLLGGNYSISRFETIEIARSKKGPPEKDGL
jgi:hypothetical protein